MILFLIFLRYNISMEEVIFNQETFYRIPEYPMIAISKYGKAITFMNLNGRAIQEPRYCRLQIDRGYVKIASNKLESLVGTKLIHRLMAFLFLTNPHDYPEVCHRDHNPQNNNLRNLEWGSRKDNCNMSWLSGNRNDSIKAAIEASKKITTWTHQEHGEFTGCDRDLVRMFPEQRICYKCLSGVRRGVGNAKQHKGWRIKL